MSIKIVTDSTACLTKEFAEKHDIKIVSLTIRFSDFEYIEGYPSEYSTFYDKLVSSKEFPKTSQPAPEVFEGVFKKLIAEGHEVICITLASFLSGTNNSANVGAKGLSQVSVIDSGAVCQSAQFLIDEALKRISEGESRKNIVEKLEEMKLKTSLNFVPINLEYLKRGGRMSHLQVSIATVLKIKPIFSFKNNNLSVAKKAIGMNMAINDLIAMIPKNVKKVVALCIGSSPFFDSLQQKIKEKFSEISLKINVISPVIGVHVGPGTVGIACLTD